MAKVLRVGALRAARKQWQGSTVTQQAGRIRLDVSLEDLQTFLVVAEFGSFSRAAERLNLSQPAISNRVRRLEEKLHTSLLTRTTRRVELTSDGARLQEQADLSLQGLRNLMLSFNNESIKRKSSVHISATMAVATVALPSIIRNFHEAHPNLTVRLHDGVPKDVTESVLSGRSDLAFMVLDDPPAGLDFELLVSESCVVITPLQHPLMHRDSSTLAEILDYPMLSVKGAGNSHGELIRIARERGLEVRDAPEARNVSNVMTLLSMAAAGLGVFIHPKMLIPWEFGSAVGIVYISDCDIRRNYGLISAKGRALSPAAKQFAEFIRSSVTGVRHGPSVSAENLGSK